MPGTPSILNERVYRALRRQGMSKQRAARISNAQSHKDAGTDAGAPLHGPGGLLATPGLLSPRKRKGKRWGQRLKCTCGIVTKAPTGQPGEHIAPGVTRIRGNLCNVHGKYGPCDTGASASAKKPKKSGAAKKPKGGAAKKPKKVAQTPEQKRSAREAEQAQNRAKVLESLNIAPDGQAALEALRAGQQPDLAALARGGFEQAGLVEQAQDGNYRLTASGRAAMAAAAAGDAGRVGDISSSARDRTSARTGRQAAASARRQAVQARREQAQRQREERARQAAKKKPSAGGKRPAGLGAPEAVQAPPRATQPAKRPQSRASAPSGPSVGGGAKREAPAKAPKPSTPAKAPKPSKEQQQASNRASVRDAMAQADQGLAPGGFDNLIALGAGKEPNDIGAKGLIDMGMAERGSDGTLRVTSAGRQAITAANRGDAQAAIDVISRASEPLKTKAAGTPGDYLVVEDPQKSTTWHLQVKRDGKPDHGLMGGAWASLHGGYRGNKYEGPGKTEAIAKLKKLYASEKMDTPATKSFIVFKDHTGAHRWLARTTTAYRDRDQEIISSDALDQDSQRMTAHKAFGPLRYWHVGQPDPLDVAQPWGPGLDIGDCDYSVLIGRTRVESGTFRDPQIAQKVAQQSDRYELSPGFFHPLDQPDNGGVFHAIRTFERSIVPTAHGRASNLFTGLAVKEQRMDLNEMEKRFKTAIADLGLNAEQAQTLGAQLVQTEKDATAQGIAFKSDAVPADEEYPDIIVNGVTYKAAPPAAMPMDAEDDPTLGGDSGVDEAAEGEPPMDESGMDGDYIGDMSVDDFKAMLTELLAPVLKMQDMVKAVGDMHGELKGMYGGVAQKDDARAAELTALKAQYTDLAAKIAQIEGDQPATILPDEVAAALKSAGPATPLKPEDPAKQAVLNDPGRPLAWLGMQTFPELYNQNGETS